MKTNDAELLASSLSQEQRKALQIVKGRRSEDSKPEISPEPLVVLCELGLVRRETVDDRELLELTVKGRRVAEFV